MLHAVEAQHPNHWATREVLIMFYSCCRISFFCVLLFTFAIFFLFYHCCHIPFAFSA